MTHKIRKNFPIPPLFSDVFCKLFSLPAILARGIENKLLFTVYVFTLPRGGIGRQYPMHEVVPSVVAMAVRMVMAMCRIFCQIDFVSMVLEFSFVVSFSGWFVFTTDSTD